MLENDFFANVTRRLPALFLKQLQFIWIISCGATMTTTVTMGLLIAVFFNILSIAFREQWPKLHILGQFQTRGIVLKVGNGDLNLNSILQRSLESPERCSEEKSLETNENVLILDCSKIAYVDHMGLNTLKQVFLTHNKESKDEVEAEPRAQGKKLILSRRILTPSLSVVTRDITQVA
uniref:STAS domain-containing protein n=1 Tax=Syphacia muris TaxID=451379 RepID=A0A0N5AP10_9BILA